MSDQCSCGSEGEDKKLAAADLEGEVRRRYAEGAQQAEACLCSPVGYDQEFLKLLPTEIIEKDYGCGDPSVHVGEGETVLDLGSGAGKICYILAQKVGAEGRVIGVDFNDAMLTLARKYEDEMAEKLGYRNFGFVKAKIQDLALDLEVAQAWLTDHPVLTVEDIVSYEAECDRLRLDDPIIPDDSIDVVVSNCVLNLVRPSDKVSLFDEIHRVLKPGGRAIISDIVCDEEPTDAMLSDPQLWSGCIAGAFREDQLLEMFEEAGFYGIEIMARQDEPWQVIDGIEFRSLTVRAYKAPELDGLDLNQALIYRGPWRRVMDDEEQVFLRGRRMAVSDLTYERLTDPCGPYSKDMIAVPSQVEVDFDEATVFDTNEPRLRSPKETKWLIREDEEEGECDCEECDCEECECEPGEGDDEGHGSHKH